MKLSHILMLAALGAGVAFTSCADDIDYVQASDGSQRFVSFAEQENLVLGMADTEFTITLIRDSLSNLDALTVPITAFDVPAFLSVPSVATFAEGEDTTFITATIANPDAMKPFVDYKVVLRIDEQFSDAYADSLYFDLTPQYNVSIVKEDYKRVATAIFAETVLFEEEWEIEIQYSETLDLYRIPDCITTGNPWFFKWDGAGNPMKADKDKLFYFADKEGAEATCTVGGNSYLGFYSGYTHPSYGPIYVCLLNDYIKDMGWDATDEALYFPVAYRVSAGSFGSNWEYFYDFQWELD